MTGWKVQTPSRNSSWRSGIFPLRHLVHQEAWTFFINYWPCLMLKSLDMSFLIVIMRESWLCIVSVLIEYVYAEILVYVITFLVRYHGLDHGPIYLYQLAVHVLMQVRGNWCRVWYRTRHVITYLSRTCNKKLSHTCTWAHLSILNSKWFPKSLRQMICPTYCITHFNNIYAMTLFLCVHVYTTLY